MIEKGRLKFRRFAPEDMMRILGDTELIAAGARLNQVAGPAYTAFLDGEIVACGGVRIAGVSEAWLSCNQVAKDNMWDLFSQSRTWLENIIRQHNLWRVWAETAKDDKAHKLFLERLNFTAKEAFLR